MPRTISRRAVLVTLPLIIPAFVLVSAALVVLLVALVFAVPAAVVAWKLSEPLPRIVSRRGPWEGYHRYEVWRTAPASGRPDDPPTLPKP